MSTVNDLGQQATAPATPAAPARVGWSPARLAYGFYTVAATAAVIGQTWVALTHVPWAPTVPGVVRIVAVLPFAMCLELLAMALSAMADERMRMGERAYGLRTFSAMVAVVAVGILVVGHWPHLYWSAAFGVLSASAYLLWLLHSAARRRDALRAAGKLADTAPDYGLWRRLRHPVWTARAAQLARQGCRDTDGGWRPLGLFESLRAAQLAMRADQRRPAIAAAVEQVVRADQRDPRMAEVAVRTLDLDRLAAELATRVDYGAWADRLAPAITAPTMTGPAPTVRGGDRADADGAGMSVPAAAASANPHKTATGTDTPAPRAADLGDGREHRPGAVDGCVVEPASRSGPRPGESTPDVDRGGPVGKGSPGARGAVSAATTAPASQHGTDAGHADRGGATVARATPAAGEDSRRPGVRAPEVHTGEAGDLDGEDVVPADTAAAVAYWQRRDSSLHPADIAARIGRSERTVRRYWPPTPARSVNGHDASDLAGDLGAA